jgi:hypothetical protein
MGRVSAGLAALLWVLLGAAAPARAEERIALVVGNGDYAHLGVLANPVSDARLISQTLDSLDFRVTTLEDADLATFSNALARFEAEVRNAGDQAVALIYFAGHGIEVDGENYLLPVEFNGQTETEVTLGSIALSGVAQSIERAGARVNFLIVDACRNNPLPGRRSAGGGLAPFETSPSGTLIAYATAPGDVAWDGGGANSPYARALSMALSAPELPAEMAFKRAGDLVLAETNDIQDPWYNSSLRGEDFYFAGRSSSGTGGGDLETAADRAAWDAIASSTVIADFERYLQRRPNGLYAAIARERIAALNTAARNRAAAESNAAAGSSFGVAMAPASSVRSAGQAPGWAWVVTRVEPDSPLAGQLQPGDAVLTIDHERLSGIEDPIAFMEQTYQARGRVDLLVRRGGASYALAIR